MEIKFCFLYMHMYVYVYICMYVCMYVCIYIYIYIYIYSKQYRGHEYVTIDQSVHKLVVLVPVEEQNC